MMNILVNIARAENVTNALSLKDKLIGILDLAVQVLIAAAVVLFLYGVVKYIASGEDETKRKEAKNYIIYGIVGLFVMVSVWGLVGILTGTFGTNLDVTDIEIPNLIP